VNDAPVGLADDVTALLRRGVDARVFPGAVAAVTSGRNRCIVAVGRETYDPSAPDTDAHALFDIASLTKVVATTTAIMQLVERDALSLDDPAARFLPKLDQPGKSGITIRQLMTHTAGFPGPYAFYRFCRTREQLLDAIDAVDLVFPPGTKRLYDDISFMLLALIVEEIVGARFDQHCATFIFVPLAMSVTSFRPITRGQIIPTEVDPERGGLLRGVVHDENAWVLGGVAGHAGLFSNVFDLMRFATMMSGAHVRVAADSLIDPVLSDDSIARVRQRAWRDDDGDYGLGWDRLRPHYMGAIDDAEVIGHTGFTGTSMVISPRHALAIILLSNRIHPKRSDPAAINAIRRALVQTALRYCPPRA
jgi:CubicO group peptidase (beta-lactamase class C family)